MTTLSQDYRETLKANVSQIINGEQNVSAEQLSQVAEIGAVCLAQIGTQFFLLVELELNIGGAEVEQVLIFRISAAQFAVLRAGGIPLCQIVTTVPTPAPGRTVKLICTFVVGGFAFSVFDVETATTDVLVLVRSPLCTIIE